MSGDSEELGRFREAVRARIEHAAVNTGRGAGEIPPAALLSLLAASGFSSVAGAPGAAELSPGGLLGAVISAAVDSLRAGRDGQPPFREELEREIFRRIQQILTADGEQAATLRAELAQVLQETGAMRSALLAAIETGNDRLRSETIAAIDTLSSEFPELAFLLRTGDAEAAAVQRRLDGQGAEFQARSEIARRQSADVRIFREDLASIRQRQSVAGRGDGPDARPWADGCPYLGLLPFDQADAAVFRGRQRLTTELMVKLAGRLAGPAMIVVSGASGAGKSSLLRAGLLPALAAGLQLPGSAGWPRMVMTPGSDPLTELAHGLATLGRSDPTAIRAALVADPDQAPLVVGQVLLACASRRDDPPPGSGEPGRLVIVVDQFEEIFTLSSGRDDASQQAFIAALIAAATRPSGPGGEPQTLVVVAVRGDFWARCVAHPGLAGMMQDGVFVVGPMTEPELRQAITGPAAAAGLEIDANLADIILADLRTADRDEAGGVLPLLSQAMMLTWGRREGNRLTVRGYNETGGVARAVEFGAEAVYAALPDAGQRIAREIFEALVLVGPDGQLARRSVPRADLSPDPRGGDRRPVDNVLEVFAGSRLLVLDGDTVQIAHDVLLRAWPRLRGWLDREQANWILHAQMQEDAARWAEHGRDSSFLYRGSQLAAVRQASAPWAADPARYPALTDDESGFLEAGRQHAARGTRVRRVAVLTLVLLLIVSAAGVAVATRADRTANQQRNMAISDQLAAQSEALDASNPIAAASLAAAAWKIDPTDEAQTAQLDVLAQPERATITAASGNITAMAFSPDGKRFATATDSGMGQIWDTATYREIGKALAVKQGSSVGIGSIFFSRNDTAIELYGGFNGPSQFYNISARRAIGSSFQVPGDIFDLGYFSPGGNIVATGGGGANVGIIDVASHREIGPLLDNAQPLTFSPDGKLLAVTVPSGQSLRGGVRLWDLATRQLVGPVMPGSDHYASAAAFSPDGKVVAVTGQNSVTFWDTGRGQTSGSPLSVTADALAFSPNGKILATFSPNNTTSTDGTVNLWDAASHQELGTALTVDADTTALAFSPDSTTLATGDGSTVSFWNVAVARQIGAIVGGSAPVALSPDGRTVAAIKDRGVGLWNIASHQEIGQPVETNSDIFDKAIATAFNPDGKILAVGTSYDVGAQLWDVSTRRRIGTPIVRGNGVVGALAFSPDGRYLAIGEGNGSAWLWDMQTHRIVGRPMINGDDYLSALAFSADGSILATAQDNEVRLFGVATHRQIGATFATGSGTINDIAFSPDGSTIATVSNSGVILWQVADQHQIGTPLDVGVGPVEVLAFSPDGTILATAGQDGAIRLWDVASHEQVGSPLVVNQNSIYGLAFSPDGTVLAAATNRTTRLWGVALTNDLQSRVCAIAGGSMTEQQWDSYVKSEPFQPTCQ